MKYTSVNVRTSDYSFRDGQPRDLVKLYSGFSNSFIIWQMSVALYPVHVIANCNFNRKTWNEVYFLPIWHNWHWAFKQTCLWCTVINCKKQSTLAESDVWNHEKTDANHGLLKAQSGGHHNKVSKSLNPQKKWNSSLQFKRQQTQHYNQW